MKKSALIFAFMVAASLSCSYTGMAQGVAVSQDNDAYHFTGKMSGSGIGTPFLYDAWAQGSVKLKNGIVYEGMRLKYDQMKDQLLYTEDGKQLKLFMEPIAEFTITQKVTDQAVVAHTFRSGYAAVDGFTENSFYEVLADGATQLIKRTRKTVVEEAPPGEIYKKKQLKEQVKYYIATSGKLTPLKKKQHILKTLGHHAAALEKYTKDQKLNLANDQDMALLVAYYNTL